MTARDPLPSILSGLTAERLDVLIQGHRDQLTHTRKTCISAIKRHCLSRERAAEITANAEAVLDLLMAIHLLLAIQKEYPVHV